jgi:hypothetical protein
MLHLPVTVSSVFGLSFTTLSQAWEMGISNSGGEY